MQVRACFMINFAAEIKYPVRVERIIRKDAGGEHCLLSLTHDKNSMRIGLFY